MLWKVYNLQSGKIVKAGFKDEDLAKEWLESREHLDPEDYMVEEMDHDEEEEWLEAHGEVEDEEEPETRAEDEFEGAATFSDGVYEGGDMDDDYLGNVYDEDEESDGDEVEEEETEDDD